MSYERRKSMASLIRTLVDLLEAETGCYKKLLDMADNKKEVIINGDVPSLQEFTKLEQELAGHLLRLEKNREENLKDICLVTNKDKAGMTISRIIDMISGEEKDALIQATQELEAVIAVFKAKNDTNKALIAQSLEYIDFTMNAVQSMRSMPESNNYQEKGSPYGGFKGKNLFDAKQ